MTLPLPIVGLTANELYHWRARVLYAPYTVMQPGITAPPQPEHGPWRRLHAGADVADIASLNSVRLAFTTAASSVPESGGAAVVNVGVTTSDGDRTAASRSVPYATANGTALAGSDYTATSGTLTFSASQTSKTVTVSVLGNTTVEANETFTVNLSGATGATIFDGQGVGTILNDD